MLSSFVSMQLMGALFADGQNASEDAQLTEYVRQVEESLNLSNRELEVME